MNEIELNIDAPIIPDHSLGGLRLRMSLLDFDLQEIIRRQTQFDSTASELVLPFEVRYRLEEGIIQVGVDVRNGKIYRLSAHRGYRGLLMESIHVGMKMHDAFEALAGLYYDHVWECILHKDYPGLAIDVPKIDPQPEVLRELSISAINVYVKEIDTPAGNKGHY